MKTKVLALVMALVLIWETSVYTKTHKMRQIGEMEFVRVLGVDRAEDGDLTLSASLSSELVSANSGSFMLKADGATVNKAVDKLSTQTDKYVFFGYVAEYLLGEQSANEDIRIYLDYLERDIYMRLDTDVYVVRGSTAEEALSSMTGGDGTLSQLLESYRKNAGMVLVPFSKSAREIIMQLERNGCAIMPMLELQSTDSSSGDSGSKKEEGGQSDSQSGSKSTDKGEKDKPIKQSGYAVFGDYKLKGFIEEKDVLGANILLMEESYSALDVKDQSGMPVGISVLDYSTKFKPAVSGNRLEKLLIETQVSVNIGESHGRDDITNQLDYISGQVEKEIKEQMENVLLLSQSLGADFLNLGKKIERAEPVKWRKYFEESWQKDLSTIPIEVNVSAKINRTYEIGLSIR